MKREQQHGLSHERVMPKKIDFNSITDAGEMFDAIMRDVRDRKKLGEDVTFKTHEFKDKWKNLRDQNIANTPITPEQKRVFQEQKAEKDSLDIDLNEKSRMQEERDKSTAMELSRKISGNELNLNRINGILSAMNEKLMDFKGKADALEDLGFFKKLLHHGWNPRSTANFNLPESQTRHFFISRSGSQTMLLEASLCIMV